MLAILDLTRKSELTNQSHAVTLSYLRVELAVLHVQLIDQTKQVLAWSGAGDIR